jgi:hypothetical protein
MIQWKFKDYRVLRSPAGISVDNDGNVYVVGFDSWIDPALVELDKDKVETALISVKLYAAYNVP